MDPKGNDFRLNSNQLLKPMKPLYGLADSGDRWHHSLQKLSTSTLKMKPGTGDLSLYSKHIGERLMGVSGVYVDDLIETGSESFKRFTETTGKRFEAKSRVHGAGTFMGMQFIQSTEKNSIEVNMKRYIQNLNLIIVPGAFEEFRSLRENLAWVVNCRPDIACSVAKYGRLLETSLMVLRTRSH